MKASVLLATLALFAAVAAPSSAAVNLVQDPGFELANSNEYVNAPDFLSDGVWQVTGGGPVFSYDVPGDSHTGNHFIELAPLANATTLYQSIDTSPDTSYDLTFFYTIQTSLTVTFGGVPVVYTTSAGSNGYSEGSAAVLALGDAESLSFTSSNGDEDLDDVSVTAVVPEPASLSLLGLAGLGLLKRRR